MGEFFNHNSFALILGFVWVVVAFLLLRGGVNGRKLLVLGGATILLTAGYLSFRPATATGDPAQQVREQIGTGKPVLLEFQSQN